MKIPFFGALALALSCTLASAQPADAPPPPLPKGEAEILADKCLAAYSEIKTYRGTTKTNNVSIMNGAENNYGGSATFLFAKPDSLRIDGKLAMGGDFSILGLREGSWYRWPLDNAGKWKKTENLSMAVSSMTGVAAFAPTTISYLLTRPAGTPSATFRSIDQAQIEGEEKIEGETCYKITARPAEKTVSWWIDKKTLLLRRIVTSFDENQSAAMTAKIQKQTEALDPKMGLEMPKLQMRFVSNTEDFLVDAINEPIDEELFAMPTEK